ncbi:MAG: hypothetical protein AAFY76_18190, partial [Cyanobacteria bacterium J06649_11]
MSSNFFDLIARFSGRQRAKTFELKGSDKKPDTLINSDVLAQESSPRYPIIPTVSEVEGPNFSNTPEAYQALLKVSLLVLKNIEPQHILEDLNGVVLRYVSGNTSTTVEFVIDALNLKLEEAEIPNRITFPQMLGVIANTPELFSNDGTILRLATADEIQANASKQSAESVIASWRTGKSVLGGDVQPLSQEKEPQIPDPIDVPSNRLTQEERVEVSQIAALNLVNRKGGAIAFEA